MGELVAEPGRGLVYGNRGCLHDGHGRIHRSHAVRRWIACRLEFRGWRRGRMMQPGRFTELFFLDEATAFAAGHRPCALCRHADYRRFGAAWGQLHPDQPGAEAIDLQLHAERLASGGARRLHRAVLDDLPDAAYVLWEEAPWLVLGDRLWAWSSAGYLTSVSRPAAARVTLITPPSLVEVLRAGWESALPLVHPSAQAR